MHLETACEHADKLGPSKSPEAVTKRVATIARKVMEMSCALKQELCKTLEKHVLSGRCKPAGEQLLVVRDKTRHKILILLVRSMVLCV